MMSFLVVTLPVYFATTAFSPRDQCRCTPGLLQSKGDAQACKKPDSSSHWCPQATQPSRVTHVLLPLFFVDGQVHAGSNPATLFSCVGDDGRKIILRAGEILSICF